MYNTFLRLTHAAASAVLPEWRISSLGLALKLRRIFSDLEIDTVIDVGANLGQYRDFLRHRCGFNGRIESFEPVPELAERLKAKARSDDGWAIHACALGARPGELTLNVAKGSVFSSFRQPTKINNDYINMLNTVSRNVSVPVSTLDTEFHGKSNLKKTYLKIDTQGFDLEVLQGGREVIAEIPALQTEVSFRPIYENMPGYAESISAFERLGFAVSDFFPAASDGERRALEFDCIMVR